MCKEVSTRLKKVFKAQSIKKQSALALEMNVDESTISRWQKDGNLSIKNAAKICDHLDISMDWLILGRGCMNQHKKFSATKTEAEVILKTRKIDENLIIHINSLLSSISRL